MDFKENDQGSSIPDDVIRHIATCQQCAAFKDILQELYLFIQHDKQTGTDPQMSERIMQATMTESVAAAFFSIGEDLLDGRLSITSPPRNDPARLYREAGIPTLWLTWREASAENWPAEHADLVEPYRLGVTGRMVTLAVMALAQ